MVGDEPLDPNLTVREPVNIRSDEIDTALYGTVFGMQTGVEVLENADDKRYVHFNNKIHALMLKKSVIEKLHHFTTGAPTQEKTLELVQKKEM